MRSAVRIQIIGIASCVLTAAALPFLWRLWPLRLVYLDLLVRYEWSHFSMALAGTAPLVLAFEASVALRSVALREGWARLAALSFVLALGTLAAAFWLYPKVTGRVWSGRALSCPSQVRITYVESGGCHGSEGLLVTTREDAEVRARPDLCPYGSLSPENTRIMVVSEARMAAILETLREHRFFEMAPVLYFDGTIDGLWKALEVDAMGHRFAVRSYALTAEGKDFDRLMDALRTAQDLPLPGSGRGSTAGRL